MLQRVAVAGKLPALLRHTEAEWPDQHRSRSISPLAVQAYAAPEASIKCDEHLRSEVPHRALVDSYTLNWRLFETPPPCGSLSSPGALGPFKSVQAVASASSAGLTDKEGRRQILGAAPSQAIVTNDNELAATLPPEQVNKSILQQERLLSALKTMLGAAPLLVSISVTFGAVAADQVISASLKELEEIAGARLKTPDDLQGVEVFAAFHLAWRKVLSKIASPQALQQIATVTNGG